MSAATLLGLNLVVLHGGADFHTSEFHESLKIHENRILYTRLL